MPSSCISTGSEAQHAAFALAFTNSRSPLPFERHTDAELIMIIQKRLPAASDAECREAIKTVRCLCSAVYAVCEEFRSGTCGHGADAARIAIGRLREQQPGFSAEEYREAFAAGLLWTGF